MFKPGMSPLRHFRSMDFESDNSADLPQAGATCPAIFSADTLRVVGAASRFRIENEIFGLLVTPCVEGWLTTIWCRFDWTQFGDGVVDEVETGVVGFVLLSRV